MNKKSASTVRLICLGIAAVLLLAAALAMILVPGAPRFGGGAAVEAVPETLDAGNTAADDGAATKLTLYEGPKTMTSSSTAKISANGHELFFSIINQGIMHMADGRDLQDQLCEIMCK